MDQKLRDLNRALASGDLTVAGPLFMARLRAGELSPSDIELLAVLGFQPAQEYYKTLGRTSKPKLTKSLWQEQGQFRGCKLAFAAINYIFLTLFNKCPDLNKSLLTTTELKKLQADVEAALLQLQNWAPRTKLADTPFKKVDKWALKIDSLPSVCKALIVDDWGMVGTENPVPLVDLENLGFTPSYSNVHNIHGLFRAREMPLSDSLTRMWIHLSSALSLITAGKVMTSTAKKNTFYIIANEILDQVKFFMVEAKFDFQMDQWTTPAPRARRWASGRPGRQDRTVSKKLGKSLKSEVTQQLAAWLLPKALELILLSTKTTPSLGARDNDYYLNEIKAGRFTNISAYSLDELPIPKRIEEIWGDNYVRFTVWTGSKVEAKKRADKVLYSLFGYIPHYSVYAKGYKTSSIQDIERGTHEDVLLTDQVEVPADVVSLWERSQLVLLEPEERNVLKQKEIWLAANIQKLRPDLY